MSHWRKGQYFLVCSRQPAAALGWWASFGMILLLVSFSPLVTCISIPPSHLEEGNHDRQVLRILNSYGIMASPWLAKRKAPRAHDYCNV